MQYPLPSHSTPYAKQLCAQWDRQQEAGRWGETEAFYTVVPRHDEDHHPAWFQPSLLAAGVNKLSEAPRLIGQAFTYARQKPPNSESLCETHQRPGQLGQAVQYSAATTALNLADAVSFYDHGPARLDADCFEKAEHSYRNQRVAHLPGCPTWPSIGISLRRNVGGATNTVWTQRSEFSNILRISATRPIGQMPSERLHFVANIFQKLLV